MRLAWPSFRNWRSYRGIALDNGRMMGSKCVTLLDLFFPSGLEDASG